jgi:hypothetical protein
MKPESSIPYSHDPDVVPILRQMNPVHPFIPYLRLILILSSHLCPYLPSFKIFVHISHLSHACYMSYSINPQFDNPNKMHNKWKNKFTLNLATKNVQDVTPKEIQLDILFIKG